MKKYLLILFVFIFTKYESFAHFTEMSDPFITCLNSGIQTDLFNKTKLTFSFDNNLTLYLINTGINYNSNNIATFYAGIGMASLLQIQYGKVIGVDEHLTRVRLDWPLFLHYNEDEDSFFKYVHVGRYYIDSDKKIHYNENFGITFSVNVNRILSKRKRW